MKVTTSRVAKKIVLTVAVFLFTAGLAIPVSTRSIHASFIRVVNAESRLEIKSLAITGTDIPLDDTNKKYITVQLPKEYKKFYLSVIPEDEDVKVTGAGMLDFTEEVQKYDFTLSKNNIKTSYVLIMKRAPEDNLATKISKTTKKVFGALELPLMVTPVALIIIFLMPLPKKKEEE